jgi:RNA polymerase sigma-70 factor (ECF subfamily)
MSVLSINSDANPALNLSRQSPCEDAGQQVLRHFQSMHLPLVRYATAFGITASDAEDVVQESFLALFQHLRLGRSSENLAGWLFKVTHNLALRKRSRGSVEVSGLDSNQMEVIDDDLDPEESMLLRERQARLQRVLRALPINDQLCLRLRAEGLTYRGIAQVVGMSLGSVSSSLTRSLLRIQAIDGGSNVRRSAASN